MKKLFHKYGFAGKIFSYADPLYVIHLILNALSILLVSFAVGKNIQFLLNAIQEFNTEAFLRYSGLSLAVLFAAMILNGFTRYFVLKRSELVGKKLFLGLFTRITRLPAAIFDTQKPGDLQSRLTFDVRNAVRIYRLDLGYICGLLFNGAGSLVLIFLIKWEIGVLALLCGMAGYLINMKFLAPIQKNARALSSDTGKLTDVFTQLIKGASTIRIFGLGQWTETKFRVHNDSIRKNGLALNRIGVFQEITQSILRNINTFLFLIITVMFLNRSGFHFGDLMAAFYYSLAAVSFFTDISRAFANLQNSYASIIRVNEIMDLSAERGNGGMLPPPGGSEVIRFDQVTFSYNKTEKLLENFSFVVMRGDIVCIQGPSGTGKSTILKLILGLYEPQQGAITVYGQNINSLSPEALRNAFSYIPQNPSLFQGTLFENIAMAKEGASREEVIEAAKKASIDDFIKSLPQQYDTGIGEGGKLLSGGQRQRIAIARSFLRDAPILLLDEPVSAADGLKAEAFYDALDTLMRDKTILLISHQSEETFLRDHFGDRIVLVLSSPQCCHSSADTASELSRQSAKADPLRLIAVQPFLIR
jgi:ATP-binding cassette subfamily B protein